jgi:hypothetical protein
MLIRTFLLNGGLNQMTFLQRFGNWLVVPCDGNIRDWRRICFLLVLHCMYAIICHHKSATKAFWFDESDEIL